MVLEAMWNHEGLISTLDIPFELQPPFRFPNPDLDNKDEDEDEEDGLEMKPSTRRRPPPLSFHRQASSLGSNFYSSLLTPKSPISPRIPEEAREVSHSQEWFDHYGAFQHVFCIPF